jgi:RimJ/RimL family protein N-acetyltransferase
VPDRLRHVYRLALAGHRGRVSGPPAPGWRLSAPTEADSEALAELMLDAYRGTIDYDGETLAEALAEVRGYFARPAWPRASWLGYVPGSLVGACLVEHWPAVGAPLIAYVMTAARWKGRGVASALLDASLQGLAGLGETEVWAVITAGNAPSEALFRRAGFEART